MKPATTVRLRLRGVTRMHALNAAVSAAPLLLLGYGLGIKHAPLSSPAFLVAGALFIALLPWLSRAMARSSFRAKCDDVAVHVGGEALPYKTIRELRLERTARRTLLHLVRSADLELVLVLRDAYAGRLAPLAPLRERLAAQGLTFDADV